VPAVLARDQVRRSRKRRAIAVANPSFGWVCRPTALPPPRRRRGAAREQHRPEARRQSTERCSSILEARKRTNGRFGHSIGKRLQPYVIRPSVDAMKAARRDQPARRGRSRHGNPDLPRRQKIVAKLAEAAANRAPTSTRVARHPRACERRRRLLCAPLRRRARSRERDHVHVRIEGGA